MLELNIPVRFVKSFVIKDLRKFPVEHVRRLLTLVRDVSKVKANARVKSCENCSIILVLSFGRQTTRLATS